MNGIKSCLEIDAVVFNMHVTLIFKGAGNR